MECGYEYRTLVQRCRQVNVEAIRKNIVLVPLYHLLSRMCKPDIELEHPRRELSVKSVGMLPTDFTLIN